VFFPPWWLLLVCLAGSALASYLLLERTQAGDSPWALYPLTALLTPVVLAGVVVVAIALSTFLSLRCLRTRAYNHPPKALVLRRP
jgi:lysylphosphatidylglycerol synthetase-like protein (DUF2156 family)